MVVVLGKGQVDVRVGGREVMFARVGEVGREEGVVDVVESGGEGGGGRDVGVRVTDQTDNSSFLECSCYLGVRLVSVRARHVTW